MKKEIVVITAITALLLIALGAFFANQNKQEIASLQSAIDELRAQLDSQNQLQESARADYEAQIRTLEINLHGAASQITNLSAALQDARENYFSDLEASRDAIETENTSDAESRTQSNRN